METTTENPTEETQTEESQLNSAVGNEAVSEATDSDSSLSLAEINEITGMSYKDKATALKSIKDMKSQAGKAADLEGKIKAAQNNPNTSNEEVQELKEQLNQLSEQLSTSEKNSFFNGNDEYAANRELIEKLAKADGISVQDVVASDMYKNVVKQPEKRTIAASNNRQAQSSSDFNPNDHKGDATALAKYVAETYLTNK